MRDLCMFGSITDQTIHQCANVVCHARIRDPTTNASRKPLEKIRSNRRKNLLTHTATHKQIVECLQGLSVSILFSEELLDCSRWKILDELRRITETGQMRDHSASDIHPTTLEELCPRCFRETDHLETERGPKDVLFLLRDSQTDLSIGVGYRSTIDHKGHLPKPTSLIERLNNSLGTVDSTRERHRRLSASHRLSLQRSQSQDIEGRREVKHRIPGASSVGHRVVNRSRCGQLKRDRRAHRVANKSTLDQVVGV
mmetsp:Transcript_15967/g.40941  ORF Transcript_15967/g.40941 Transcript_15967/m.40941 type:complete len:255 (-) Transcript_15967:1092-1856(-)